MKVDVTYREGVIIFKPAGAITGNNVMIVRRVIYEELGKHSNPIHILFDLSNVSRLYSTGMGMVMEIHLTVKHKGGRTGVIHISTHIKNLLVIDSLGHSFGTL